MKILRWNDISRILIGAWGFNETDEFAFRLDNRTPLLVSTRSVLTPLRVLTSAEVMIAEFLTF